MRHQNQRQGKFYTVLSQTGLNQQYATTDPYLPKGARGHMVMVLGWADQLNWVEVVTVSIPFFQHRACNAVAKRVILIIEQITSSAASTSQYIDYLPIYPSKKNQHSGIQLRLCNDWDAWTLTAKRSYIRMDEAYEIPVECLMPAGANGRQYELQSKSWEKVQDFMRDRNVQTVHNGQVAPDSVNSHPSQVFDAGVAPDAGQYSSHMPV